MKKLLFTLLMILLISFSITCGTKDTAKTENEKTKEISKSLEPSSDSRDGAIRVVQEGLKKTGAFQVFSPYGTYISTYIQKDALFSYWQAEKLWDYTYIVVFGHKHADDEQMRFASYLVDTKLNAYITVTFNKVYSDDIQKTMQDKFETGSSGGSDSDAISIVQNSFSTTWQTINDAYFTATASREKTKQFYWNAKKIRAHTFIVSITSSPLEYMEKLKEYLCKDAKTECNPGEKVVPGRYFYVNTKLSQAKEITNNANFSNLIVASKLFEDIIK